MHTIYSTCYRTCILDDYVLLCTLPTAKLEEYQIIASVEHYLRLTSYSAKRSVAINCCKRTVKYIRNHPSTVIYVINTYILCKKDDFLMFNFKNNLSVPS